MGLNQSKKKQGQVKIFTHDGPTDGDVLNRSLIQYALQGDTKKMITVINSGVDMASPYNGAPLLYSATLAILNDPNHERFVENWEIICNALGEDGQVPVLKSVKVMTTNFTKSYINKRENCLPFVHVNHLDRDLAKTKYGYYKTVGLGVSQNVNMQKLMLLVMSNIHDALDLVSSAESGFTYSKYDGTEIEEAGKVIEKNAQYIADNMNDIERFWDGTITAQEYYEKYGPNYVMNDQIPMAEPAPVSTSNTDPNTDPETGKK